jgi:hypothetical protein
MDFSRRRGPPAPLQLGAAYQAKVLRGFKKFHTPLPMESCLLVDSACDQTVRQSSKEEMQRQRDSAESRRLSKSTESDTIYTLDGTQIDSCDEGSEYTIWSYEDTHSHDISSRSSYSSQFSSDGEEKHPEGSLASRRCSYAHSSTDSTKSPIKVPAMCRIEQAGVHSWTGNERAHEHHRRSKSL